MLLSFSKQNTSVVLAVLAVAGLAGLLAVLVPARLALAIIAVLTAIVITALWPMIGWSLVVFFYPFIYLQFFIGQKINIPYVDAFALLTFAGVATRFLITKIRDGRFFNIQHSTFKIPGLLPFFLFILVAALSLVNVDDVGAGVKFLFRPLTFFYLMYVLLPMMIIDSPRRLFTALKVLFLVGGIAALMGLWSLIFPPEPGAFRRAVPIIIHGMTPLGTSHNLIAEVLVSVIPIGILLAWYAQGLKRRWYIIGTCFFALINLSTFSRNGWLTLALEVLILLAALARGRNISWRRIFLWAAPLAITAGLLVGLFSTTNIARSSNINRLRLTEIALAQFREHPIIGAGVGTFMEAVSRDRWYIADFGQPQEAHGLIQKLLAETGLLGLLAFLALLAAIVRYVLGVYQKAKGAADRWRPLLLALLLSASGSIIFQLFNTSYFVSKLWIFLGVAVAAAKLAERATAKHI